MILASMAGRLGCPAEATNALNESAVPEFAMLHEALVCWAPKEAIAQVRHAALDERYGPDRARAIYLALAVSQVPFAEAEHKRKGIPPDITAATLQDIGVWVRHFAKQGLCGISLDTLEWGQRYLRGNLLRIGSAQFDPMEFSGPIRVFRHPETQALSVVTLDGRAINEDGKATETRPDHDGWLAAFEPGAHALEMHFPANARISPEQAVPSALRAIEFFGAWKPDVAPLGVFGESWVFDPQICAMLPRNAGLHRMAKVGSLYPCPPSEGVTIERVFGLGITRADLPRLPREKLNSLQRSIVELLRDPDASLAARGSLLLRDELYALA